MARFRESGFEPARELERIPLIVARFAFPGPTAGHRWISTCRRDSADGRASGLYYTRIGSAADCHSASRQLHGDEESLASSHRAGSGPPGFHGEDQDPSLVWGRAEHENRFAQYRHKMRMAEEDSPPDEHPAEQSLVLCAPVPVHFVIADGIVRWTETVRSTALLVRWQDRVGRRCRCCRRELARLMDRSRTNLCTFCEGSKFKRKRSSCADR